MINSQEYRILNDVNEIDINQWDDLIKQSNVATWFQTKVAYKFYESLPSIMIPFVVALVKNNVLRGIVVGYITQEKNPIKQLLTRRAIIVGGPLLANYITNQEVELLMSATRKSLKGKAIYIETRNFNDFSAWKEGFIASGFEYVPHLNFHVNTTNWESVEQNIGKHRKKYIRLSYRDGASVVLQPTLEQIKEYYLLLDDLYRTKIKTPLYPYEFFENLYKESTSQFILVSYNDEIVGGSCCVTLANKGVYEWFACGKDGLYKNIYPSSVTKHAGMKFASDNNYPLFDMMGAGKPDEKYGVRDFKAEFGGDLVEHGRYLCIVNKFLYNLGKIGLRILRGK